MQIITRLTTQVRG